MTTQLLALCKQSLSTMQQCMCKDHYRSKSCARIVALYNNLAVKYRRNLCKSLTYIASPLQQSCSESIGILQKLVQESNMLALHCKLTSVCINCCREYLARRMHQWSYIIYASQVASFCKINNFLHARKDHLQDQHSFFQDTATQFSVYPGTHAWRIYPLTLTDCSSFLKCRTKSWVINSI